MGQKKTGIRQSLPWSSCFPFSVAGGGSEAEAQANGSGFEVPIQVIGLQGEAAKVIVFAFQLAGHVVLADMQVKHAKGNAKPPKPTGGGVAIKKDIQVACGGGGAHGVAQTEVHQGNGELVKDIKGAYLCGEVACAVSQGKVVGLVTQAQQKRKLDPDKLAGNRISGFAALAIVNHNLVGHADTDRKKFVCRKGAGRAAQG